MHTIKQCLWALLMALGLAGCGGPGDEGGGGSYLTIQSTGLTVNGAPATSETVLEKSTGGTFSVAWSVSFSELTNLYRVELVLIDAAGGEKQVFAQNCSSEAGFLYNCGTTATVNCTVGSGVVACTIGDYTSGNTSIGNDAGLEFRACIHNANLDYECSKQPLNLRLVGTPSTPTEDTPLTEVEKTLLRPPEQTATSGAGLSADLLPPAPPSL